MKFAVSLLGTVLFLLSGTILLKAQDGWTQTPGCTGVSPTPLLFMINACPDNSNEAFNEYFMFQAGTSPYNINGAGTSLSVSCPAGSINSSLSSFGANAAAVAVLNSLIGPCPSGNVFVDAMAPAGLNGNIPANGIVMAFTTNTPDYSALPAGYLSSLCGASPIYVIFGNYPGPLPMFKNYGCTGCGCIRYISLSFGGCTYSVDYDVQNLVTPAGTAGDADGAFITLQPAGAIGYDNDNGECIPVAEFCTPPPSPVLATASFTICNGQAAPTFTCTNCDANSGWYNSEFGSTLLGSGTTFTPSPAPVTTTTYWVQNSADCNSDRVPATVTVNPNPTVSVSIPGGFSYCQGQSISLSASGSSNVGPAPTYNWTISGPGGTVNATGVTPTITISNAGTYSINLVLTNTSTTCSGSQTFNNILTINPASNAFSAGPLTQCETAPGQATFNLSSLDNIVNGGSGQAVTWFLNAPLTIVSSSPNAQLITGGSTTVYAVVNYNVVGQCASAAVAVNLVINAPVTPVLTAIPPVCNIAAPVALATTQSGITGNWSGSGVSGNMFNPSGLSGSIVLTFTPTAGQCAVPATTSVSITTAVPVVISNAPAATLCNLAAPVGLNTTQSGIPGNWSGSGVSGNVFTPSGLSGSVVLTFTPTAGQCALPNTSTVNVTTAAPVVIGSPPPATLCSTASSIALNPTQSGVPGNWSGSGVSGNLFSPSGLSGSVVLTFTPTAGQCALSATTTVNITSAVPVIISAPPVLTLCSTDSPVVLNVTQSGISGNWSGTGVSGNQFNPAGLSGAVVLTFTPAAGNCALPNTLSVNVTGATVVLLNNLPPATICSTDAPVVLSATQSGGVSGNWSGTGVSGNQFNPAGLNGSVILTFTPAAGNCLLPNTTTLVVTSATPVAINFPPPASLCNSAAPVTLTNLQSGITGNWSGTGVSGNQFSPTGIVAPSVTLTFTPDAGQCALPASVFILVNQASAVTLSDLPPASYCNLDPPVSLSTLQSGLTGVWSGTGVSGNQFDPGAVGGASATLTFTPDAGQCSLPNTFTISVLQSVPVTITAPPLPSICSSAAAFSLNVVQSGISGVWSGPGVFSSQFSPAGLSGNVTLTFAPAAGQCALPNTVVIVVTLAAPVVINNLPPLNFCSTDAAVVLNATQSGVTGAWSGTGVTGGQFNPTGLNGNIVLTFTPNAGQCALANTISVAVAPALPVVLNNIPPLSLCNSAAPVVLNTGQSGIAGTWSGAGVTGNIWNIAGLVGNIVLTFTPNAGQCALANTLDVVVIPLPNASTNPPGVAQLCNNAGGGNITSIPLNSLIAGDAGGNWTTDAPAGTIQAGNIFNATGLPDNQVYTVTYTVPGIFPCPDAVTSQTITVINCSAACTENATTTAPPSLCGIAGNTFDLTTLLVAGVSTPGGTWTTNAPAGTVSGNTFDPDGLTGTFTLTYSVTGAAGCPSISSNQTINIVAPPNAATLPPVALLCNAAGSAALNLTTLVTGDAGGFWTSPDAPAALTGNLFNPSGLAAGNYDVVYTVLSVAPCALNAITTQTITVSAANTTAGPDDSVCSFTYFLNGFSGFAGNWSVATAPTGTATAVFSDPASPQSGVTVSETGTYAFVWTAVGDPCIVQDIVLIDFTAPPLANAGADATVCGFTQTLAATGTGIWSYTGTETVSFADNTSPNSPVNVLTEGVYTFVWTTGSGLCSDSDEVEHTFNSPITATQNIVCSADLSNYTVTLTISGGVAPYFVNGLPVVGNTYTGTFTNNANYSLTITDSSGCTPLLIGGTQNCTCPPVADPVLNPFSGNLCFGQPFPIVSVVPNGTDTYQWFFGGAPVATGTTFTPTAGGNYSVQAIAPNNCVSPFVPFTITVLPLPLSPALNASYDFCAGAVLPVLVSAAPGNSLQWSGSENGSGAGFQPTLNTSGIYLYDIVEISPDGCVSPVASTTVTITNCACPTIVLISSDAILCSGSSVTLNSTLSSNLNLDRVEWLAPDGTTVLSTANTVDISETITACSPQTFTYTFNLYCSDNPAVVSSSGTVSLTFYPIPDAVITLSPDGCQLTATPNCADFLVAPNAVQTTSVNGNTDPVTFTVINNDAALLGLPCSFTSLTANFNCQISTCPFIVGLAPGSMTEVCSGDEYSLTLETTDPATLSSVEWFAGGALAGTGQSISLTAPVFTGCDPQSIAVTANIYCISDPATIWDTENFTITVYPPFDNTFLTFSSDCAALPTLVSGCANYQITPVSVPAPVTGNNSATWDISYSGNACIAETVTFDYTCSAGQCPQITLALNANSDICAGNLPDFAGFEANITFDDPDGNANGFAWFADAALTIPLSPADYAHSGSCLAETFTLYAALLCNSGPAVFAGTVQLAVFPTPTTVAPVGGCSLLVEDNCGDVLMIEYLQTDGTWSAALPNPTPVFGETADWRAYVAGTPDNDGDGQPDCFQTGTVTAICGCTPPPPPVGVVTDLSVCEGQVNTASFEATTIADTYIIWINAATGLPLADGLTYTPTAPGTYFAQAVLDANDLCVSTQVSFTLTEIPADDASFSYANAQYCLNDAPAIPVIGGTPGGIFTVSGGAGIDAVTGEMNFTALGNFTVTYTTAGTCPDSQNFSISVIDCTTCTPPPPPAGIVTGLTVCEGQVNAAGFEVSTAAGTFVNWYDSSGALSGTGNIFVATTPGTYTAQAVETGNETCVSTVISATLTEVPNDDASFSYEGTDFCQNASNPVPVVVTPGGIFTASGGIAVNAGTGEIDLSTAPAGGSFTITYTTGGVCPDIQTTAVNIIASAVAVEAGEDLVICEGETAPLNGLLVQGTGNSTWSAIPGGVFDDVNDLTTGFTPSQTGSFTIYLTAQDVCGNVALDSLTLTVLPQVIISITGQSNLNAGQSTQLTASGASAYIWQSDPTLSCTDCPDPVATPTQTTTYFVSGTDACSEQASFTIIVSPDQDKLIVPNAFSPNEDGVNDEFRATTNGEVSAFLMQVYNRWGEIVFETGNPAEGWDGTFRGELQEIGVYVFYIRYTFEDSGTEQFVKGNVTLVR
ncbi:MAG: gliding motility-associated C-terminal domain-containing protein [Sphingobacteriales bacterium]|nr:MAG: gliding motility-associated C-terminal domain-containing protein [Sphingobacteriales bacterium]